MDEGKEWKLRPILKVNCRIINVYMYVCDTKGNERLLRKSNESNVEKYLVTRKCYFKDSEENVFCLGENYAL